MTDQNNGHLIPALDLPDMSTAPDPQQQRQVPVDMVLNTFIWPLVINTTNGLRLSCRMAPYEHVLVRFCGLVGRAIGETVKIGALADVLTVRSKCIAAFNAGIREVKPELPPPGSFDVKPPQRMGG